MSAVLALLAGLTTLGAMFGLFAPMGLWIIAAAAYERGDLRREQELRRLAFRIFLYGLACLPLTGVLVTLYNR